MGFTAAQASRLAGCTRAQLEYWERCGLIARVADSTSPYSFRDLVTLRMVRSLLDAGLPLARIRRAVDALLSVGEDIAGLRIVTDGEIDFYEVKYFDNLDRGTMLERYFDGDASKLAVLLDPTRLNSPMHQFRQEMTAGFKSLEGPATCSTGPGPTPVH